MPFNPYETRPVGSKQYEEHIQDVHVSQYYQRQIPGSEEDPAKLAPYGHKIWKSDPEIDPIEKLVTAMTVQAVIDYVNAYKEWQEAISEGNSGWEVRVHSYMLTLENDFFRRYSLTEMVFDRLLKELQEDTYQGILHTASYITNKVYRNYNAYCLEQKGKKKGASYYGQKKSGTRGAC